MKRLFNVLATAGASAVFTVCAFGQGTDTCTTPTVIAGLGSFPFNITTATTGTEGQTSILCNQSGQIAINRDVWFAWTAPSTNQFEVSSCGGATFDSKIAVYVGSACPGAGAIACNDDSCGLQSKASFAGTSGTTYVFQLGTFPGATVNTPTGNFTIAVGPPPYPCNRLGGPDVIVGDLQDIVNHTAAGGIDAISLGTYSCNVGDVNLKWISGTNEHPVIGGNLYRFRTVSGAGRFEQIGMSWLKHGFFALSNDLCCIGCQGTDGTALGVSCADPYTAARNGTQGGLGPRWQVNAHTGVFTYMPANPAWSGSVARRLQYLQSDVDTTVGVRYFGEGQYVTQDDAAAGNQNNNASYRELTVTGGGSGFALSGSTVRETSAIRAWAVCESGVTLNDVQVAGDGLFVIGSKATSLGGGQYHYEYAVYNMNADRNGGSFSIPKSVGATITNIGFHDVDYRNGDGNGSVNFAGTDWTVTQTANAITWACETELANNNANALRWGSTYNFRFDANAAPTTGLATLGLWKAGAPANVTANVDVPSGGLFTTFCIGDGTSVACPCANSGAAGNGCANSTFAVGGNLSALGNAGASNGSDSLVLTATNIPGPALFIQSNGQGATLAFGDGQLCASVGIIRLGVVFPTGSSASYPGGLTPNPIHTAGLIVAGDTRHYQAWYRDAAVFCTAQTYNLTQGVTLVWGP
jgi:hypothetical protein